LFVVGTGFQPQSSKPVVHRRLCGRNQARLGNFNRRLVDCPPSVFHDDTLVLARIRYQVVGHGEYVRDTVSANSGHVLIRFVVDHALQLDVPALHDDVN